MTKPDVKELHFWEDLPYQSELSFFLSRESPYQLRFLVRGITMEKTEELTKEIREHLRSFPRKKYE